MTEDFTMESLAPMLLESPKVIAWADEITARLGAMNAYRGGKGDDRQKYLSLWSGNSIKVDRKSAKTSVFVERPFFAFTGGIQPDCLELLKADKDRDDGFVDRILFASPAVDRVPDLTDQGIPDQARALWDRVCATLYGYEADAQGNPVVLHLSPAAYQKLKDWHTSHRAEATAPDFPEHLHGPWSKLKAYLVRLALILYMLDRALKDSGLSDQDPGPEVAEDHVQRAWVLVDYFKDHHRGVWTALAYDQESRKVEELVKWTRNNGGRCTVVDVVTEPRFRVKARSAARRLLAKVVDRGYGRLVREGRKEVFVLGGLEDE